jgi:hypothetical protein
MILRDRLLGRVKKVQLDANASSAISRLGIDSGSYVLDAIFVQSAGERARAALLICHGIGETVDHWLAVQNLLAAHGVASLVFDYAGYGKSTGIVGWEQCENDAVQAYRQLRASAPELPVSVLGFSMGSGIAVANRIRPAHLILCAAFTSFSEAACALGLPKRLASIAPPIWNTRESLRQCASNIIVVHGLEDRVFPAKMASELASSPAAPAELLLVPNLRHNEPFYHPTLSYWGAVIRRLVPY